MKFSIAFNGDIKLFSNLPSIAEGQVREVFGVHPLVKSPLGNARTFIYTSPQESLTAVVQEAKKRGVVFNYLLNSTCLSSLYNNGGLTVLERFIEELLAQQVEAVTAAEPYLLEWLKKRYPFLKVYASTVLQINSAEKAKYFEELGVDKIILCWNINRDFETLRQIREAVNVELEVLANDWCILGCPYRFSHYCASSHISAPGDQTPFSLHHFYETKCVWHRLKDPSLLIKTPWIRPEDIKAYEEIGIDSLKITERTASTEWNLKILKNYLERSYQGNLWNLLADVSDTEWIIEYDLEKIFYVDNQKLDDFLTFFINGSCHGNCFKCSYCPKVTKEALIILNQDLRREAILAAEKRLNEVGKFCERKQPNHI